jgi:ABC-type transport system involved in cytochrome c biogenesis permease subunit
VNWFSDRHLFLLAVVIYGISMLYSVFLFRKGFRQDSLVSYILMLVALFFHTGCMALRGFSLRHCPVNNLFEATVFITWTIVAFYLVLGLMSKWRFLGAFASPVIFMMGVFALMPALDPPHGPQPQFSNSLASIHASLILLGFGAFGMGAAASLMYLTQEHDLKFRKLRAVLSVLPPIQRLERISSGLVTAGFVLLTAGLSLYPLLLRERHEEHFKMDPILIWSFVVWMSYLGLLLLRWRGQGGRNFAWGAVASFLFIILTYWGVILLSPVHKS